MESETKNETKANTKMETTGKTKMKWRTQGRKCADEDEAGENKKAKPKNMATQMKTN